MIITPCQLTQKQLQALSLYNQNTEPWEPRQMSTSDSVSTMFTVRIHSINALQIQNIRNTFMLVGGSPCPVVAATKTTSGSDAKCSCTTINNTELTS